VDADIPADKPPVGDRFFRPLSSRRATHPRRGRNSPIYFAAVLWSQGRLRARAHGGRRTAQPAAKGCGPPKAGRD